MKALIVLRKKLLFLKRQVQGFGYNKDIDYKNTVDKEIIEVKEAIEELELLIKKVEAANSCLGCKYDDYDRDCFECSDCKRNCNDNFEEEDIK